MCSSHFAEFLAESMDTPEHLKGLKCPETGVDLTYTRKALETVMRFPIKDEEGVLALLTILQSNSPCEQVSVRFGLPDGDHMLIKVVRTVAGRKEGRQVIVSRGVVEAYQGEDEPDPDDGHLFSKL